MNLKEISKELESEGYLPAIQILDSKETLFFAIPDKKGEPLLNSISNIQIINGKIVLLYYVRQIDVNEEFKTIEELLKFVRQVFPIEE